MTDCAFFAGKYRRSAMVESSAWQKAAAPSPARMMLYSATAAILTLLGYSAFSGFPPLTIALPTLAAYIAIIGSGVAYLPLDMFVEALCRGHHGARGVALTFDDGPHPEHTPRVLDLLDKAGAKATFFVMGRKAAAHPALVREIAARGHLIGIHSHGHDRLLSLRTPGAVRADLSLAIATVEKITGVRPTLFRPPVGLSSPRIAKALQSLEVLVVGWSVRGIDGWRGARPARVAERVIKKIHDGAIVQLHDAAEHDDFSPA